MPYIKKKGRPKFDKVVKLMAQIRPFFNNNMVNILVCFCKECVGPSYNNYKNFCGELRQCANEIERRILYTRPTQIASDEKDFADLDSIVKLMKEVGVQANGDLNYILFKYCKYYVYNKEDFCYKLRKCAELVEKELLAPYEDEKIKENGDV